MRLVILGMVVGMVLATGAHAQGDLGARIAAAQQQLAEIRARTGRTSSYAVPERGVPATSAPAYSSAPVSAGAYSAPQYAAPAAQYAAAAPRGVFTGGRVRVGVLPFENQAPQIPGNFVSGLEAMVISEGLNRTEWSMLDRLISSDILREQKFARSGLVRAGTGPAATGNLGAQVLIKGVVTGLTQNSKGGGFGVGFGGLSVGRSGSAATLSMDIRIVDAATGEVLAAGARSTKIKSSDLSVGYQFTRGGPNLGGNSFKNQPAEEAARRLVGQILELLAQGVKRCVISTPTAPVFSGRIARLGGGYVYINGGADKGITLGQQFRVIRAGAAIIDPQTGENLGAAGGTVGVVRVMNVQPRFATCNVVSGGPFAVNDMIEP